MLEKWISQLESGAPLNETDSFNCLQTIFQTDTNDDSIVTLLQLLNHTGSRLETLIGFCKAIQASMITISLPENCIDVCGTGGSGKNRFNVSTASAFVCASIGIKVAKHGNRGSKKPNGSFDFLEALTIPFGQEVPVLESLIKNENLCFIFARKHHPKLAKMAPARKTIGTQTIFNLIGPLCNPGELNYQVIGTTCEKTANLLAETKQRLGTKKTIIVIGANGLDELSTTGPSTLLTVTENDIKKTTLNPKKLGFPTRTESEIEGKSAQDNARLFTELLDTNNTEHPISELILLNSGLASYCIGHSESLEEGISNARTALSSGQTTDFFNTYKRKLSKD